MSTAARFDLTMDADDKAILARAAALAGTTMAAFVRAAAKEKALTMIDQESHIRLSQRDFAAFTYALNQGFKPNRALSQALKRAEGLKRGAR